ncbi:MAG: TRAP transporter substrate-binding protein DctP [Beijerinckiaceae bacterium]
MNLTRRAALAGLTAPGVFGLSRKALAAPRVLKLSHQFPSSNGKEGDFRDRLCRRFADAVEKRTNGELKFDIYPGSSLMKTFSQFDALRKGALDLSLVPTTYAGGEIPEMNLTFMPAIVTSYDQAYRWKTAAIGQEMTRLLDEKGVTIVTWLWESGGIAAKARPVFKPSDAAGLKIRGGSREMDTMFKAAGAGTTNMPSNEIYVSMQTGAIDACATSSTSLMSFKLHEMSKHLTAPGKAGSFFFVLEPILASKQVFESLSPDQQKVIMSVGEEIEKVGREEAMADDVELVEVYKKAGVSVHELDEATLGQWRDLARDSAWKDFAARSPGTAKFLKLAEAA